MTFLASKAQLRASFLRWSLFMVPLVVLLGFLSGGLGSPNTVWFQNLDKPAIFPPPYLFGIVWSVLYVMIGLALALVASAWGAFGRGLALVVFGLHFLGNLAWSPVFFALQDIDAALWVLVYVNASLVAVIALFWRIRRIAALLLVPYLAWTLFAMVLNYQFIAANPGADAQIDDGAVERIEL
ncbi:TspO/MBR family protein [Qipengyuania nanhaisediminis]|uniref:TspO/MBR family protein n=1 Tax=Qipengyuania nanhaisediminis TaxID=604088 RepID=UPI0038B32543